MRLRHHRVAFVVYREGLGPIFSSVYLVPAARLVDAGLDVKLLTFSAVGEWLRPELKHRWKSLKLSAGELLEKKIYRIPSPPARWRSAWKEDLLFRFWLRRLYGRKRNVILHCGSSQAAVLAVRARESLPNLKVIYQVWGPEAAEYLHTRSIGRSGKIASSVEAEAARLEVLQRLAMREADAIICISHEMTRWAIAEYGADPVKILEVPCFVDTRRFAPVDTETRIAVRSQLGVGDRFMVVYTGSMFSWQFPERCFDLLNAIRFEIAPGALFVALTTSPGTMRSQLERHGFDKDSARIVSVAYEDVPRYVAAADLAVLGRNLGEAPSLVNRISSPVKFGEYLSCGVPVILSEGVGDYSRYVGENDLGLVIPYLADEVQVGQMLGRFFERYRNDWDALRQNARCFAEQHLSADIHVPRLQWLYDSLGCNGINL